MKKVMVFGTFDILHAGHENFFKQAKKYGDFLIVVVARDETSEKIKGRRPINSEESRARRLLKFPFIDKVVLGDAMDQYKVIRDYDPDVLCLGYDQEAFTFLLQERFPKKKIYRMKAYKPHIYKSSKITNLKI